MARKKRIFVAFAVEDNGSKQLLKGQSLNTASPFEYTDMGLDKPLDSSWKTRVRERIKGCDGTIALLSGHTIQADGARWEIKCSVEEHVPILGVKLNNSITRYPPELPGNTAGPWAWDRIAAFINRL